MYIVMRLSQNDVIQNESPVVSGMGRCNAAVSSALLKLNDIVQARDVSSHVTNSRDVMPHAHKQNANHQPQ